MHLYLHCVYTCEWLWLSSLTIEGAQGLAYGLRAAAGVEAVVPVPGGRLMAGLSLLGAAIAEGGAAMAKAGSDT